MTKGAATRAGASSAGAKQPGRCLLASLEHPSLGGSLPCLALVEGLLAPRARSFSCCDGSGLRLSDDAAMTLGCKLGERLRETRRLAYQLHEASGGELAATLEQELRPGPQFSQALQVLHLIAKAGRSTGLSWTDPLPSAKASEGQAKAQPITTTSVWAVALAAAWRFGLKVHVVQLGGVWSGPLVPPQDKPAPAIICVGKVGGLWDPHIAEKLETIVSYAYGAITPLFLQLEVGRRPKQAGAEGSWQPRSYLKVDQLVAERLAAARAKEPLAWLAPACIAKLTAVSSGLVAPGPEA